MDFKVESSYNPETNIGILKLIGSPISHQEIDVAVENAAKVWAHDKNKTYALTDLTELDFTKFEIMSYYERQVAPFVNGKLAFSVVVSTKTSMDILSRAYNVISGRQLPIVHNHEDAMALITKEQQKLGVFPAL